MRVGDVVGDRFVLQALAGAGGMGRVYRATDRTSGETVAVKVLLEGNRAEKTRFAREARVLAELHHPAIVRYIDHGEASAGEPWLAMEWLEGEDLGRCLRRKRMPLDAAITLVTRVAEALGAAHARGIVHRDLKPSNLFLVDGRPEAVTVLDFGIAHLGATTRLTAAGTALGTPGYMAPEQARSGEALDARVDVFALGCVLFECVTGQAAFSGAHMLALVAKLLFEEAPRMSELRPGLPASLDELVADMLSKEPSRRPPDGAAVAALLSAMGSADSTRIEAASSRSTSARSNSLTRSERRLLCVVVVGNDEPRPVRAEAPTVITPVHEEMRRVLEAHGGSLAVLADGSLVGTIVGGTSSATDQAAQAARCALALAALLPERPMVLSAGWAEVTGRLPVGTAAERAAGLLMNLRPRRGGAPAIAIDQSIAGLLDARFDVQDDDDGVCWLRGERGILPGARTLLGKPTPCVGRERELSLLEGLWSECNDEEPRACAALVTAPAGIGKSRLAHEFLSAVKAQGKSVSIWVGRGDSLRAGSRFGLLGQALRGACGIREDEPLADRRQKLSARVRERVAEEQQRRVAEFLGELVGAPYPDRESAPLRAARQDAHLMLEQLQGAWLSFLRAECEARPVLLVLEDLHWGDLPTVRFVDVALRECSELPFMVLALARPAVHELFPRLWSERWMQEIRLKELGKKARERLVRQVLGADAEMIARLVELSEGNAFYLEELIRAAAEGRGDKLPETLVAMVQSRLGSLEDDARNLLRAASVLGEVFWPGAVAALLGEPVESVEEKLRDLAERELFVRRPESRFSGEEEYAFRHALLREGAYAMLTEADRTLGHKLAGEWLEARGESDALLLAEHFEQGKEAARAGVFWLRAAEQANAAGDTSAAIARAQRGLACAAPELRLPLLGMLCEAHMWRGLALGAVMPYAEEAMQIAPPGSATWAQGAFVMIGASLQAGRLDKFQSTLDALLAIDLACEGPTGLAAALGGAVSRLDILGKVTYANAFLERLESLAAGAEEKAPTVVTWWLNICAMRTAYALDAPHEALRYARQSMPIHRRVNHRRGLAGAMLFQGTSLFYLGAFEPALASLEEAKLVDEELATAGSARRFVLSWLLADRGAPLEEARAPADGLIAYGRAKSLRLDEGRGHWALAEVLRRNGALAEAESAIQAALAILGVVSPLDHPGALATLAAIRLDQGRTAEARAAAEEAFTRYESIGACGMFRAGYLRLVHAECREASGDRPAARAAIESARGRLLAIAAKIDEPAHQRSFLEDVPENARTLELAQQWLGAGG